MSLARLPDEPFETWVARVEAFALAQRGQTGQQFESDLVPDVGFTPNRETLEIDLVLGGIDIVTAYQTWCGKSEVKSGSRRESIMVSCPNPDHPDTHPSAWLNLDKGDGGVGTCGSCGIGFDKYDIFAWHQGLPVPGYKDHFTDMRREMAIELGFTVSVTAGQTYVAPAEPEPIAPVISLYPSTIELEIMAKDDFTPPSFDWRELPAISPGTFLHQWLSITTQTSNPEEYYFWLGCEALGLAAGNNVHLVGPNPYRANLMICLVGDPAVGKSTAINELNRLLHQALPFYAEVGNNGVLISSRIASGEALVDVLSVTVDDPATDTKVQLPIRALVHDAELAALMSRSNRHGSTLKETMQDFYDFEFPVSTQSRAAGFRIAKEHFVSFVTSTQHNRLRDLLHSHDEASGFISRWIFVYGKSKPRVSWDEERIDTSPCIEPLRKLRAWASSPRMVNIHNSAYRAHWDNWFQTVLDPVISNALTSSLARLDLACRKILLLFAINDRSTSITLEHLQSLEILWPYLLGGYGIVHDAIAVDPLTLLMDEIETFVERFFKDQNKWPTARDIGRGFRNKPAKDLKYSLDSLVQNNQLTEVLQKGGQGRPTKRYRLTADEDQPPVYRT